MNKFSNLRNRPFLIVNTIERPAKGVNTAKKGWADDRANWAIFENPYLTDRVSNKIMREATVIIDVMSSKVVKSRFNEVKDDEVAEHYMTKYKEQVAEAMDIWLSRMAKRIAADPTLNPNEQITAVREALAAAVPGSEETTTEA